MWLKSTILAMAGVFSLSAAAISMGDMEVSSEMGEPLEAQVFIRHSDKTDVDNILVKVADVEQYKLAGLERPYFHSKIDAKVVAKGGKTLVTLGSDDLVRESYLHLLLALESPEGQVLKEFVVFFDLPQEPK